MRLSDAISPAMGIKMGLAADFRACFCNPRIKSNPVPAFLVSLSTTQYNHFVSIGMWTVSVASLDFRSNLSWACTGRAKRGFRCRNRFSSSLSFMPTSPFSRRFRGPGRPHKPGPIISLGCFVQGVSLRMATAPCWNRANFMPFGITFYGADATPPRITSPAVGCWLRQGHRPGPAPTHSQRHPSAVRSQGTCHEMSSGSSAGSLEHPSGWPCQQRPVRLHR
jgi:hypothetical protein